MKPKPPRLSSEITRLLEQIESDHATGEVLRAETEAMKARTASSLADLRDQSQRLASRA